MGKAQGFSMAELTGTAVDGESVSAVPRWLERRGGGGWVAPVHEVAGDEWKAAFRFAEPLGSGGFGSVTRATHLGTGTDVAIKLVYDRTDDGAPSAKSESVRREVEGMRRLDHPAVVALLEVFVHKPAPQAEHPEAPWVRQWYLVLEFCAGEDLQVPLRRLPHNCLRNGCALSALLPLPPRLACRCCSAGRARCRSRWPSRSSGSSRSPSSTRTGGAVRSRSRTAGSAQGAHARKP